MHAFLIEYINQVESLLALISACRSSDWKGYLAALENYVKYFFAHDLLNYARLMPIHLAQMNALEKDDPATWEALKSGDFVVAKSEVPFTCLFTDQTSGARDQKVEGSRWHGRFESGRSHFKSSGHYNSSSCPNSSAVSR